MVRPVSVAQLVSAAQPMSGQADRRGAPLAIRAHEGELRQGRPALRHLGRLLLLASLVILHVAGCAARGDSPDLSAYPWAYLRADEPLASSDDVLEVLAVGDVMLGRSLDGQTNPLSAVGRWLAGADLTVGNLECVITDVAENAGRGLSAGPPLQAPPSSARLLQQAGFDLLSLANNHSLDLGQEGLAETVSHLHGAGVHTVGAGADAAAAFHPFVHEQDGVRMAFLAFNGVLDGSGGRGGWTRADWDAERAVGVVEAAREEADGVVVLVHWGYEYETRVDPIQRAAAQLLLEAGADLVIGHHPHVIQALAVDDGGCVAYSLGNFVFDQGEDKTTRGLALRAFFDRDGLRAVQVLPVVAGPRPRLMPLDEADAVLERVRPESPRLAFSWSDEVCQPVEVGTRAGADVAESARFYGGRVDLTGDGVREHVRRVGEQVLVYENGVEVWRSPSNWRVVDVALGDPNWDGRSEMLLALWKPGLDGLEPPCPEKEHTLRSRPFIVGHRGGTYRTLWGGSAVERPILELELGDLNGDGAHELVVLEEAGRQERTLSVWRWHGWGFTLVWRSDPGPYSDLRLADDGTITVALD